MLGGWLVLGGHLTPKDVKFEEKPPDDNYCEVTLDRKDELFTHKKKNKKDTSFMGTMNERRTFIIWLIISIILAMIFARYSQGLCAYLFVSFAWLFIWTLATQSWSCGERVKEDVAFALFATVLGWVIGTFVVWRSVPFSRGFFQKW